MSQRFETLLRLLRRLALSAGYAAGVLWFWLGAHEVFEGPKTHAALLYGLLLLALGWPLLAERLPWAWVHRRQALWVGGFLLGMTLLSWLGAYSVLPANLSLGVERTLPLILAALGALFWLLEDEAQRRRVLFVVLATHWALLFYGLLQLLDQNWGQAHGVAVDVIRWVRFGESRVYSTMGNPDYMAGHLTVYGAFWLALGWRRVDPRGPAQAAALGLLAVPWVVVPTVYGASGLAAFGRVMGPWTLLGLGLFVLARRLSARACWLWGLGLLGLLVLAAQGRGAWLAALLSALAMAGAAWHLQGVDFFVRRRKVLRWPILGAGALVLLLAALLAARTVKPKAAWIQVGVPAKILSVTDSVLHRVTHIFDRASDAQVVRRFYWQAAWRLGLSHPLLGVGYGNHALFTARAQSGVWKQWEAAGDPRTRLVEPHVELYAHNDFLQNFAETGFLGLAAFLFFWAWFLREAWREAVAGRDLENPRRLELGLGLLGAAVALLGNALTNFPWRVLATQQLCWLAFAVLALARFPDPASGVEAPPQPRFRSREAMGAGLLLAAFLALFPLRWFVASLFIRQGNQYKDGAVDAARAAQGIRWYEKAVRLGLSGTQRVETLLYLGSLYNVVGRADEAERYFRECVRIYPDFLEAWYNLGYTAQLRLGVSRSQADLDAAVAAYERVLEVNPRAVNALNNLGNLRYQAGQVDAARDLYLRLLKYHPDSLEGWYNLAATEARRGDRAAAEAALAECLQRQADFAPALQLRDSLRRLPKGYVPPKG